MLPESRCLQFDCGVRVQLGFAAEFSNIMVVYSRILHRPSHVVACTAQLSDFSEVRGFGQGGSEGGGGLFAVPPPQTSNPRLCSSPSPHGFQDVDVDLKLTNRESPRDAGSWLLAADISAELSLYTRFTALQKLKVRTLRSALSW